MIHQRTSFYYDPIRQGYDNSLWHTLYGAPVVIPTGLEITSTAMIHFADCMKGEYVFNLKIPSAPGTSGSRRFGVMSYNKGAYIYFDISGDFTGNISDGQGNTASVSLVWDTNWTGAFVEFKVRWESGTAKFYANGTHLGSVNHIGVSGSPMSPYIVNESSDSVVLKYMEALGLQYYLLTTGVETIVATSPILIPLIFAGENVTVTEGLTFFIVTLVPSTFDSVAVSENVRINPSIPLMSEAVTVTDVPTIVRI